jgi:hypothetical protein
MGRTHCGSLTNWWRRVTALASGLADFLLTEEVLGVASSSEEYGPGIF